MHIKKSNNQASNPYFKGAKSAEVQDLLHREASVKRLGDAVTNWLTCCQCIKAMRYGLGASAVADFIEAQRKLKTAIKGLQQWE